MTIGGKYFAATNEQAILDALKKILAEIQSINSTFASASLPVNEDVKRSAPALLGELNALVIYRANDHWTIRGGYSLLYLDGVALAAENFNSTNPFIQPARTAQALNNTGNALYHGGFLGCEWMW